MEVALGRLPLERRDGEYPPVIDSDPIREMNLSQSARGLPM